MSGDNPYGGGFSGYGAAQINQAPVESEEAAISGGHVKETTTQGFAQDVIAESRKQPVLVDFWAPWCGPCKQLTPVIEKVVNAAGGRVKLVKMNIDDHPAVAGQLGIQSIPAVICFKNGQPVDGFMGAQPEAKIREFIDKVAGPDQSALDMAAAMTAANEALAAGNVEGAAEAFSTVANQDPDNEKAFAGLAECLVVMGDLEQAREVLAHIPETKRKGAEVLAAFAKVELHEQAAKMGDPKALEVRLADNPKDHQARFDLAMILNVQGARDEAADHLLAIMKADRTWNEDGARKQLVQLFEAWGPMDPSTLTARRKLSGLLFS
ncbi:MAG: thioredoxin [Rhizobiaceae bacterium]